MTTPRGVETLQVVVVGDVMVDVLAAMSGPLARGSDTPSRVTTAGGGSAARRRWIFPGAALGISYERIVEDKILHVVKVGFRVAFDIAL